MPLPPIPTEGGNENQGVEKTPQATGNKQGNQLFLKTLKQSKREEDITSKPLLTFPAFTCISLPILYFRVAHTGYILIPPASIKFA